MLTNGDIQKLSTILVTKQEFEEFKEEVATKVDFRRVMTILDKVLKEVLAMRQEQTFHTQKHAEIDERLEKIEKVTGTTPL